MSSSQASQPFQPPQSEGTTIPLISIGVHRLADLNAVLTEKGTPYRIVAFLDFDPATTPAAYQYSVHNLGVLLYALHPRPRGLLTGNAVEFVREGGGVVEEVRGVWEGYVRDCLGKEEGEEVKACYAPVSC